MQKYGILLVIWLILLGCIQTEEGWDVTVRGKIRSSKGEKEVYVEQVDGHNKAFGKKQQIAVRKDGSFETKLHLTEPGYFRFNFYDLQQVNLIVDHSDLELEVDGNVPGGFVEVKGSPDRALIKQVHTMLAEVENTPRARELNKEFGEATKNLDQEKLRAVEQEYMTLIFAAHDKVAMLLREQGPSIAVINLLNEGIIGRERYADLYAHVAEKLEKEWPDYTVAKEFIAGVEQQAALEVGKVAPEISLPNSEGQIVKLSSLRGNYVLIDFWAKWCGPCRRENPNVVRAYNRYHDKGFEVFGVSLDSKKNEWLQAIQEDGLVWAQVSDLKSFESPVVQKYRVNAIPMSILLDPDGVIIAKDLRGESLQQHLQSIFGA